MNFDEVVKFEVKKEDKHSGAVRLLVELQSGNKLNVCMDRYEYEMFLSKQKLLNCGVDLELLREFEDTSYQLGWQRALDNAALAY